MDGQRSLQCRESGQGFFKNYYQQLRCTVTEDRLKAFGFLKTDEERVRFVSDLMSEPGKRLQIDWIDNGKNPSESAKFKERGNEAFISNDNGQALSLYTKALVNVPHGGESPNDEAVILANRSATLYHMEEYSLAIGDIDRALSLGYPRHLRYKVHERKAKCLLALKKCNEAIGEFQSTLRTLDDAEISPKKRLKMQTDVQIMLRLLEKQREDSSAVRGSHESNRREEPELCSKRHRAYVAACDKMDIFYEASVGRYAAAVTDIQVGQVLLVERPYCSVLLPDFSLTHCIHCLRRTRAPYPCRRCRSVVFCSEMCRLSADDSYHRYECSISDTIYSSGASVTVLMALRAVTQKEFRFFLEKRQTFDEERELSAYESSDYETLHRLVRHEDKRQTNDFFERTVMAVFLLQALRKTEYFPPEVTGVDELTPGECLVGGLILRSLQSLQFNAHEIFEIQKSSGQTWGETKSVFIGGGLFPTLSLFNHSCDPGVVRYFAGSTVVVRAIKPIKKGEIIAENYGPMFTSMGRERRRAKLKSQYWFDCSCIPCTENWPTFDEMKGNVLPFRCDSNDGGKKKTKRCDNVIAVPQNTDEFTVKCNSCGRHTNLLKGLKTLQDTDLMYRQASKDADAGKFEVALTTYLKILSMLHSVVAPPFRDYHLCQQSIRKCMLCLGNVFVS